MSASTIAGTIGLAFLAMLTIAIIVLHSCTYDPPGNEVVQPTTTMDEYTRPAPATPEDERTTTTGEATIGTREETTVLLPPSGGVRIW